MQKGKSVMQKMAIIFLRFALIAMSIGVLAICTLLLPALWKDVAKEFPDYAYAVYAVFSAMILAALPFFAGVFGAWRLLECIDTRKPFTKKAAKSVKNIATAAALISLIYTVSLPFFFVWADRDDAPGLMVIGMVLVGAPLVISVFASILYRLITEAVALKKENELTV